VTVVTEVPKPLPRPTLIHRVIVRPEIGAALGAAAVFVFFSIVTDKFLSPLGIATWLDDASRWASWPSRWRC
jgi:simple sugar transport system permease protein